MLDETGENVDDPREREYEPPKDKKRKLQLLFPEQDSDSEYQPSEPDSNIDQEEVAESENEIESIEIQQSPGTPRQRNDSENMFPFKDDEDKLKVLCARLKKGEPGDLEKYKEFLPEANPDKRNYMTTEEIYEHYDAEINSLLNKIKEIELKKLETLRRHEKLMRLYANSKKENPMIKMKIPKPQDQRQRPNFLCPLPYCAGHALNIRRHRIIAHPEIKDEEDKEFYDTLVKEMKTSLQEKVMEMSADHLTANQALLLKMNSTKKKIEEPAPTPTPTPTLDTVQDQVEKPIKKNRNYYSCPLCKKVYPSIAQHITRKHHRMEPFQKNELRRKMFSLKHKKPEARVTTTHQEYLTANLTASMKKLYKGIPPDVSGAITDLVSQIEFVIQQREINSAQTLGLIKRIIHYSIRFATTNHENKGSFAWTEALSQGIKDLLTDNNLNHLAVLDKRFSPPMKKKALDVIIKLLNFYERGYKRPIGTFELFTTDKIQMLRTLVKARSTRLDKQVREYQTENIVDEIEKGTSKFPTMQQAFYASKQKSIKKIFKEIIQIGKKVEAGEISNVALRNPKLDMGRSILDEETRKAEITTNAAGEKTAFISLQQYRRAIILAICGQNARRSLEICTYSIDKYRKDLEISQKKDNDTILLHFRQHKTASNQKAAIAVLKGLEKDALYHYVKNIRRFIVPDTFKNVFFSNQIKQLTFTSLNNDLTKIFKIAYPSTNLTITTRTFRKVLTTYCQKVPEFADEVASLLCHDPSTARKYYDLTKGMSAATRGYNKISESLTSPGSDLNPTTDEENENDDITTTAVTTLQTISSTTTTKSSQPDSEACSSTGEFSLDKLIEELEKSKMTPREKFLKIFEKIGPVPLPYQIYVKALNVSQKKTSKARIASYYSNALCEYKKSRKIVQED